MSEDSHLDGNAIGALLEDVFGWEMTNRAGCCGGCGTVSVVGAVLVYRSGPGDVVRCPACQAVLMVLIQQETEIRVGFESLRWLSVPVALAGEARSGVE